MRFTQTFVAVAMAACSVSALAVPVSGETGKRGDASVDYIYTQKETEKRGDASVDYIYTQKETEKRGDASVDYIYTQ
ncbi:hypothetical protein DHEL01_v210968 [Diaporthe helianthi]|uniref:Uncharacterized protein n=1 Tax=Diaporthe helianthi TaxID=158607 RepID=A0A2P5HK71_DIAHE|nr:hypothetical protein DHEL01_v210968 [Diaporthe helianthi]